MTDSMTDTMSLSSLEASLTESLMDSAQRFSDDGQSMSELLLVAAEEMSKIRRRMEMDSIQLIAGQDTYPAPDDFIDFKSSLWGQQQRRTRQPWQAGYPRQLPSVSIVNGSPNYLVLIPAPTGDMIGTLGSEFKFVYFASIHLDEDPSKTTLAVNDRSLLLLRAQAEAMKWLAMRNVDKTVSTKHAVSGASQGGIPSTLYHMLLTDWERRASC